MCCAEFFGVLVFIIKRHPRLVRVVGLEPTKELRRYNGWVMAKPQPYGRIDEAFTQGEPATLVHRH
jgi:hypothetical protein